MKRTLSRALVTAALTFAGIGLAQAEPIYFDFTGTVFQTTLSPGEPDAIGTKVSGGFNFETDRLYKTDSSSDPRTIIYVDWQPTDLAEPLAFLNVAGRSVSIPTYSDNNYSIIEYVDACQADLTCTPGWAENFSLFASSSDGTIPEDFTGTLHTTSIYFDSAALRSLPDYPFNEVFDYFDGDTVDPESVTTLPLYSMFGSLLEDTTTCVQGACTFFSHQYQFDIDSVTRGIGPRSVPEPGVASLLGLGCAGLMFTRRRRLALRQ